jgi:hypothetical protein
MCDCVCRYNTLGHPSAVVVDVGRQLFVDSFLVDPAATNATVTFHAPALEAAPRGTQVGGGGLWWDAAAGHFKNCPGPPRAFTRP